MTSERMKDGLSKRKINYFLNETAAIVLRAHTHTLFAFGFGQHTQYDKSFGSFLRFIMHYIWVLILFHAAMKIFQVYISDLFRSIFFFYFYTFFIPNTGHTDNSTNAQGFIVHSSQWERETEKLMKSLTCARKIKVAYGNLQWICE